MRFPVPLVSVMLGFLVTLVLFVNLQELLYWYALDGDVYHVYFGLRKF